MQATAENPDWGWFALVYYVPDPVKAAVHKLRETLPGNELPPAHVTVLPPRLLRLPPQSFCKRIAQRLAQLPAFEIALSGISFFPETNYIYIDIAEGGAKLKQIHEALNKEDVSEHELFAFHPHLTLAGPVPRELLAQTQESLNQAWKTMPGPHRLSIDEIVCLWRPGNNSHERWRKIGSFLLDGRPSSSTFKAIGRT